MTYNLVVHNILLTVTYAMETLLKFGLAHNVS